MFYKNYSILDYLLAYSTVLPPIFQYMSSSIILSLQIESMLELLWWIKVSEKKVTPFHTYRVATYHIKYLLHFWTLLMQIQVRFQTLFPQLTNMGCIYFLLFLLEFLAVYSSWLVPWSLGFLLAMGVFSADSWRHWFLLECPLGRFLMLLVFSYCRVSSWWILDAIGFFLL